MQVSATIKRAGLVGVALLWSQGAWAHPGHGDLQGFASGFAHPWSGLDHLLAMVAVGIWAAQLGRRARWALPVAFPLMMVAGGVLGMTQWAVPGVEAAIALSSLLLGAMVLLQVQTRTLLASSLVGIFALFHGVAHGAEIPHGANGVFYAAGFVGGTVLLHAVGLALGSLHQSSAGKNALRAAGAVISAAGGFFLLNALS